MYPYYPTFPQQPQPQPQAQPGQLQKILVSGIRGRNGGTAVYELTEDACVEALNVDFHNTSLGRRRSGASAMSLSGAPFTGTVSFLESFVPLGKQTARELWGVDDAVTPNWGRLAGGTVWATITPGDPVLDNAQEIEGVSFNRKFFFGYHSSVDRLHVWDGSTFRRVGLPAAAAPSVIDSGSGTYAATNRTYKVRWVVMPSGQVNRAGDLSDAVSFTPSGSGAGAQITQPSPPGEGETHWEIYGAADGSSYFRVAQVAVSSTTYVDSADPTTYSGPAPPDVLTFITPQSAKYLIADKARLVMAGAWNPSDTNVFTKSTRYSWTAPLGATDNGDDERVENNSTFKNFDDIEEDVNGLGGPIDGSILVFSANGVWQAVNTGLAESPYQTGRITGALGTIHHRTVVVAEDELGGACCYWLSPVGPCRFGVSTGFRRCHYDLDDFWPTVNLTATMPPHGRYHRDKHQIWWHVPTGSNNECDTRIVFDVALGRVIDVQGLISVRRGWAKHTGPSCAARCSAMMSDGLGATMSWTLKPYLGISGQTAIWKGDTGTNDNGTNFQAYILTKPYLPWSARNLGGCPEELVLAGQLAAGVTISVSVIKDWGYETVIGTVSLADYGGGTTPSRIVRQVDGSRFSRAKVVQFQIGDGAAANADWNLDLLIGNAVVDGPA